MFSALQLLLHTGLLAARNITLGLGEDAEAAGEAIQNAAQLAKAEPKET